MDDPELTRTAKTIVWDYRYRPEAVAEVLRGRRERVGHLDRPALFVRMLQTMPWQRVVTALALDEAAKKHARAARSVAIRLGAPVNIWSINVLSDDLPVRLDQPHVLVC